MGRDLKIEAVYREIVNKREWCIVNIYGDGVRYICKSIH